MTTPAQRVVVLGASAKPDKYSYQAVTMLSEHGHTAIPVHPSGKEVAGIATLKTIGEVAQPIDTVSLYVGPATSNELAEDILASKPRRIIMNPGAENENLKLTAEQRGIEVIEGCTLVMLRTGQF